MGKRLSILCLLASSIIQTAQAFEYIKLFCHDSDPAIRFEEFRCCPKEFACSLALDAPRLKRYRDCTIVIYDLREQEVDRFCSTVAFFNAYLDYDQIQATERATARKNVISHFLQRRIAQKKAPFLAP